MASSAINKPMTPSIHLYQDDCLKHIHHCDQSFDLSFIDPPFNQGKEYRLFHDSQDDDAYWQWVNDYLHAIRQKTSSGGAVYFMQREKNTARVMQSLLDTGWHFQNLIIWKKKTSAVPCQNRFGKHYQIIAYATNGKRARVFHRLKIKPPKPPHYKYDYTNGRFLTDVWDDIREMTSGYFAGTEALRNNEGNRCHKQQSPLALLTRIILSSTKVGDTILDPFAGTGTTLIAARQLKRHCVGIEIDPVNATLIQKRLDDHRPADDIQKYHNDYIFTDKLDEIWGKENTISTKTRTNKPLTHDDETLPLFIP